MSIQTMELVGDHLEELKQRVQEFEICWEVWPDYLMVRGSKLQVGFELLLAGAHERATHVTPGCPKCLDLFEHLKRIATWLLPNVEGQSFCEIEAYDHSIHRTMKRKQRPDVMLSLKILHRRGYDQPVDASEVECLNEMQNKLKRIGAQPDVWHDSN